MKTNKIVGVILGLAVLCGIGLDGSAYGQLRRNRNWDGYPNWGGSYDLRQTALNAGYNEGSREYETENPGQIRNDRNDRNVRNDRNDRNDRNSDRDRNDNNRQSRGRNWDRYGTYGGSYQLRQTALNAGYNEG